MKKAQVIPLKRPPAGSAPSPAARISEFYVHAVLQAARALKLGLDMNSAKSWGLNRAIFYEAAKNGYIGRGPSKRSQPYFQGEAPRPRNYGVLYKMGGERAYTVRSKDGGMRFVIGGKEQTPEKFDRQVQRRFPNWEQVWSDALYLMNTAPKQNLSSPSRFHNEIYRHWRVDLAERWASPHSEPLGAIARRVRT